MKKLWLLFAAQLYFLNVHAQGINSLAPYQALTHLNPSFAGSNGLFRSQTTYSQRTNRFEAISNSALQNTTDAYIKAIKSGIAFSSHQQQFGNAFSTKFYSITYAKYFELKNKPIKIIPSIQFGFGNTSTIHNRIFNQFSTNYHSINSGVLVVYKNFFCGLSSYNTIPFHTKVPLPYSERFLFNFHASYNINISENFMLNMAIKATNQLSYSHPTSLALNSLLFKRIIIGSGILSEDIVFFNAGYKGDFFTAQLGYDEYFGRLGSFFSAWKLMLSCNLQNKQLKNFEAW